MQRIYYLNIDQATIRNDEAEFHAREIKWAIWCLAIVAAIFLFTVYMVMHIETITSAKGL